MPPLEGSIPQPERPIPVLEGQGQEQAENMVNPEGENMDGEHSVQGMFMYNRLGI